MVGYELTVTATFRKLGKLSNGDSHQALVFDNPVTASGIVIDDHLWIKKRDVIDAIPYMRRGDKVKFTGVPTMYYDKFNEVGYSLGEINFLTINDEAIQVRY